MVGGPQCPKVDPEDEQDKLWLIVRYMTIENKTNEFRISEGETIKLGRVKFTVREMVVSDDENKTDYDSFENGQELLLEEEAKAG